MSGSEGLDEKTLSLLIEKVASRFPEKSLLELAPIISRVVYRVLEEKGLEDSIGDIVEAGKHFNDLGFVMGASGNISVRLPGDRILITPSGLNKGTLVRDDILTVDLDGNLLCPSHRKPSSETKMHLICYRHRPDVQAIVHTHPPFATGFATARIPLDMPVLPEAILVLGDIPLVEYATPSTWEVPEKLEPYLKDHNAFLLANHGALTLGRNLKEASHRMETLELFAKVILISRMLGKEKLLSKSELDKLKDACSRRS